MKRIGRFPSTGRQEMLSLRGWWTSGSIIWVMTCKFKSTLTVRSNFQCTCYCWLLLKGRSFSCTSAWIHRSKFTPGYLAVHLIVYRYGLKGNCNWVFHDSSSDEKVIGDGWNETVWVGVERLECEIHWSDTVSSPQLVYELLQSIETYHTRGCHRSLKSLPRQMQRLSIGSGQQVPMRPILDQYIPSLVEG